MKKGHIILIAGPSGVGKGTIRKKLTDDKSLNLGFSVSYTTREPRPNEIDGVDYFFVSKEKFINMLNNDGFLEHAYFVNNYYGTSKEYVDNLIKQGKNVVLEIECEGAKQVMKKYSKDELVSFFILPPTLKDLEERLRKRRTESEKIILERLNKGKSEMSLNTLFDHTIINDDATRAYQEIKDIILNLDK